MSRVTVLVPGEASGEALVLDVPLSLWRGVDPATGRIVEASHPQFGESISGKVLAMPHGRGSSSSSTILAESLRRGVGPAAIVLDRPDPVLVVGALVARHLYDVPCPVVTSDTRPVGGGAYRISGGDMSHLPTA